MYTTLIVIHVIAMISSMTLMSGAVVLGLSSKPSAVRVASVGMISTAVGFASGLLLMLDTILTFKCTVLTAYVLGVSALYYFGYGFGNIKNARLVRGL